MTDHKESMKIKYRPKTFSELFGNETNRKSFISHIKKVDADTFLLSGSSGTGKTTFSKLMSSFIVKKYGGNSLSIKEINVSDKTGVEFAREIVEECSYSPMYGCAIYILNEVHKASDSWQNCLLDLFEHPPENTFFVLCTTEPEKLKPAIVKRATKYKFKELSKEHSISLINDTCEKENIEIDEKTIEKVYQVSAGCPRDIMSILEAIRNLKPDQINEYLEDFVSGSDNVEIKDLVSELMNQSSMDKAFELLDSIKEAPESIRMAIISYFYRIMVKPFGNEKKKEEMRLRASLILEVFKETVIYSGKPGLALSIYNYYS